MILGVRVFLIAWFLILIIDNPVSAQLKDRQCSQPGLLLQMMEKFHFQPVQLDDKVSDEIFMEFLKTLDPHSLYFTKVEFNLLLPYRYQLDEAIKNKDCSFLNKVTSLYKERLLKTDSVIVEILNKPFDFSIRDTITFVKKNKEAPIYADNEKSFKKRWNKWLRYETLKDIFTPEEETDEPCNKTVGELLVMEAGKRKKIGEKEEKKIKRILQHPMGFENCVASVFLNVIAMRFDPHSSYFSLSQKNHFVESLSAETFSFGFSLNENQKGEIEIERLVPGGPAWKSNEIHIGDILMQVKWPGKKPIDLSFTTIGKAEDALRSSDEALVDITVKTINGQLKTVTLVKEKIRVDENVINGYMLKGDKNIGYISLPDFYSQHDSELEMGCANDIAKEIIKLRKEKIDGLIIDLRFNGGGSMHEAIGLAGIFIQEGPLSVVADGKKKPTVLKDINRGTIYDGPLILLVNAMSASASEFLAAALQDYNRALIVGSATYGKATYQSILPMDTAYNPEMRVSDKKGELGYVKITLGKFYRVTGKSHQKTGVVPDIVLPEITDNNEYREISEPFALSSDSISKKVYYTPLPALPRKEIAAKSNERVKKNKTFQLIRTFQDSLELALNSNKIILLDIESFKKEEMKIEMNTRSMEKNTANPSVSYTVTNNQYDADLLEMDLNKKERNDDLLKQIMEDIYIEESVRILSDLITINETIKN